MKKAKERIEGFNGEQKYVCMAGSVVDRPHVYPPNTNRGIDL